MSDNDLSRALQQIIGAGPPPESQSRWLVQEIVRRDQRGVRVLAGLSLLFWLAAGAGLLLLVLSLDRFVIFVRIADRLPHEGQTEGSFAARARALSKYEDALQHGTNMLHHSIPLLAGSVGALLLAALCTVLLVFSSRRATLHQIHLSLLAISEQIKELASRER
jgi:hypothetical protein